MTTTPPLDPSPTPSETDGRSRSSRPILLGAAAVVIVAVVAAGVVLATRSDEDASACLAGLVDHMPADVAFVAGADLVAAREAGYDDSTVDAYIDTAMTTGVSPDPLTRQLIATRFLDVDLADAPYDPNDLDCWMGEHVSFVARGDFDRERVEGAELAEVVVATEEDLVAVDAEMLEVSDPPEGLEPAFEAMSVPGLLSFSLISSPDEDDDAWIGLGLVEGNGDDADAFELRIVWSYATDTTAATAEGQLRDILATESVVDDILDGDPVELLRRSGSVLTLQGSLGDEPTRWIQPLVRLDPAIHFDTSGS